MKLTYNIKIKIKIKIKIEIEINFKIIPICSTLPS